MTTDKYLTYRGDLKAVAASGNVLAFTTAHPEGRPTAVYRLDADKLTLTESPLPCGGAALVADDGDLRAAGTDGRVYAVPAAGAPAARGPQFPAAPTALAPLSDNRLAVLAGSAVTILARRAGQALQTLELPEPGTCLAADPTGKWLAVGTAKGTVAVFDGEDKDEFLPAESERLHEGAVTALLFEPEELRFFSAGADNKLLSTHARGKLEPEDRGRGNMHSDVVTALGWGPGDRFVSGSRDGSVKSWPRVGKVAPATVKDGVGKVVALAVVSLNDKPHLAAACDDNTLRLFPFDEDGRVEELSHRLHGALERAKHEFAQDDARRREAAIQELAGYDDTASVELLSEQVGKDADHGLRLLAARRLADCSHPRAVKLLEPWLKHPDEAVRLAALQGLRQKLGGADLRPLDLALAAEKADVGREAVRGLEALAAKDDQALARLTAALDHKTPEVRQAALTSLEKAYDPQSPEADLFALGSKFADVRRLALVRLFQRKMLGHAKPQAALRRRAEDDDPAVRHVAFLLSLHTRPKLLEALRARDPELARQLAELVGVEPKPPAEAPPPADLAEADYDPLLQATASRALDACLRGARGLAVLGDPRAFGLLLQLSREDDTAARVEVCRALSALDDPRAVNRLRSLLYDAQAAVRDAAFSALDHIHADQPLQSAESGLNAAFEDVRRRGLQVLIGVIRKAPPKKADEPAWKLLTRALNDNFPSVRGEAFKAALNLQVGGGGVETFRFILQSVHADVRLEVLTEMMAQSGEAWAWNLLLEFFNDHDPTLRGEAFSFAVKKTKDKDLGPLETGLASQYADVRKQAVDGLIKKRTKAAQALLVRALADRDKEVRQLALGALIGEDARPPLVEALTSPHADVRVRAARALARHGEKAALAPLLELASAPEPEQRERRPDWLALVREALDGLGELGDVAALGHVAPLLHSPHDAVRRAAAGAVVWVALPRHPETLRQALQHSDPQVKYRAALGLAYAGDDLGAALVFSAEAAPILSPEERLTAALMLGPAGEDQLVAFLDAAEEPVRNHALLLMMLLELKANSGTPARCLACLSSRMPRVRLTAARALETFAHADDFREFVVQLFNDRGEGTAWKVPAETVDTVAELLVHAPPAARARTGLLLKTLSEKEQDAWDQAWGAHAERFAAEVGEARRQAGDRRPPAPAQTPADLQRLAFGAYVGLVREQGRAVPAAQVVRVRQTAISRILALAAADAEYARAARPVLVQALGDPNQPVRVQAFEGLQTLGMDATALGAEALEAGHTDLGVRGLQLLSGGASDARGQAVLEQVMLSRPDNLALEAAKLLLPQRGAPVVAGQALAAAHAPLRQQAVAWLAAEYDKDAAARDRLREALASRYLQVREAAAVALANKKDAAAFDALVKLLQTAQDAGKQRIVVNALTTLGDPRAAAAFLDRLENDPGGTALTDDLFRAAGQYRRPETADRLLALMGKEGKQRAAAYAAALAVSGYDQRIQDSEDESPDRKWEEKQHPRRDAVLARLMERCFALGETKLLYGLVPGARWARGPEVGPVLALLAGHPDDRLRQSAVEALGWRLRKRGGSRDALVKALGHKDPQTQFLAAEGLARAGRPEGLTVLLTSVEYLSDVRMRQRAVRALGELADVRALDVLLKLAEEDGNALQEEAAEAVGRLGRSAKGEEIFQLLERFGKRNDGVAEKALRGLRWLNVRAGWQLIRKRAADPTFHFRETAAELLGYDDDPAGRELLLRLLAGDDRDSDVLSAALTSARRLWGPDSLEPDYAVLQNAEAEEENDFQEALKRVCARGEVGRVFAVFPKTVPDAREALTTSLLNRAELPVAEARAALGGPDAPTVRLAARVLGRAGARAADAGPPLGEAIDRWRAAWEERRRQMVRENRTADARLADEVTPCLRALLWAAGRVGGAAPAVVAAAAARPDDRLYRPVRREATAALAALPPSAAVDAALETAALGEDAEARTLAADALARRDAARAARLAEKVLPDRVSFNRLAADVGSRVEGTLRTAAGQLHYQGVALPLLVARGDVEALAAVAANRKLPEAARLSAVEGLGALACEPAEDRLRQIGTAEGEEEELRKAAWRALRRSKRARGRRAKQTGSAVAREATKKPREGGSK
jgi:ParB family chromosome partitioning protein